jgi:hypothetical protein
VPSLHFGSLPGIAMLSPVALPKLPGVVCRYFFLADAYSSSFSDDLHNAQFSYEVFTASSGGSS